MRTQAQKATKTGQFKLTLIESSTWSKLLYWAFGNTYAKLRENLKEKSVQKLTPKY